MRTQELTGPQAELLARFLASLRPGQRAWTVAAVSDALGKAAVEHTRDAWALTVAALDATLDVKVATPAVIAARGSHWDAASRGTTSDPEPARPGFFRSMCPRCQWFHHPDSSCEPPRPTEHLAEAAKAARQALSDARSDS